MSDLKFADTLSRGEFGDEDVHFHLEPLDKQNHSVRKLGRKRCESLHYAILTVSAAYACAVLGF